MISLQMLLELEEKRNSQTAQDPGCMQGGVGPEVSVVLRHLEFDDLRVGAHCHAAVLCLYHCEPACV